MKRGIVLSVLFLAVCIYFSNVSFAGNSSIGTTLEDFKLSDTSGKELAFKDLAGKKGTIIVFLSAQCPVVKGYNERIRQVAADYKDRGINVVGINSNSTEAIAWVKSNAEENYKFPVLIDKGNVIADKLNAASTPEVYLFDTNNKLVYHGAIDNDRSGANISNNYLRTALDEFLAGKSISKSETKAFGCSIKRSGS